MPISTASPARGAGALSQGCYHVGMTFTTSSEAVTETLGQTGFSVGDFSTGVATITFPKHFKFLAGVCHVNTDNASAASRQNMELRNINLSAGTATLRVTDSASGATEAAANGTYRLVLTCGE